MSDDLSLTGQLANHLMRQVLDADRRRARLHLLDWLGCVLGALPSQNGERPLSRLSGNTLDRATWLGNVLEMDDIHRTAILHPGPVIWPAALTSSSCAAPTFDARLDAAIRGYDAMIAIGETLDARHYAFFHNTSTAGAFGAAVTCADMLGGTAEKLMSAIGFAGSVSGGLWQMRHEDCDAKQWHLMHALHTGVLSAQAAHASFKAPEYILEGPQGLYAATCDHPKPMQFTARWRIHEVSIKLWGACRHAHPAIDAALELKAAGGLDGDAHLESYADAITFCDQPDPKTVTDAKFSIQHAVAIVAERGVPQLADFEPDAIAELADARTRVTVSHAPDITARYPAHFGARITSDAGSHELIDTLGDPERPLSDAGIEDKARALMAWGGLSDSEADDVIAAALTASDAQSVIDILDKHL